MGLIYPSGPSWAHCSHNLTGTISTAGVVFGTQVASGVSNADGSAVSVLSALAHDVEYLQIVLGTVTASSGIDNNALMDILIDPAGGTSWSVLIPSLGVGGLTAPVFGAAPVPPSGFYDFPIWIPAGASIGAQARCAAASLQTLSVMMRASGGNANPASWWCGQRVSAIGTDAANSRGTAHTSGASGSFSSWANFGSTLGAACGAVQWSVMGEANAAWATRTYEFEFGVGSVRIGPPVNRSLTSGESGFWFPTGPIFKQLPAGTQFQCRAKSSGTALSPTVAAYAVH